MREQLKVVYTGLEAAIATATVIIHTIKAMVFLLLLQPLIVRGSKLLNNDDYGQDAANYLSRTEFSDKKQLKHSIEVEVMHEIGSSSENDEIQ